MRFKKKMPPVWILLPAEYIQKVKIEVSAKKAIRDRTQDNKWSDV